MRDLVDELLQATVKSRLFGGDHAPVLGRLRLLERIGAGAMGTVFAAYDTRLERKVAVKVLRTRSGAERVLAEARALARLAHPNVVTVHDADELDGLVFIVMELAPGVPLRAWTATRRDWREVVRALREAALGIAAAHDAGLVHRDIKPDNILIGERARVVDFGLAHPHDGGDGTSAGTPFYMAPEVLAGEVATAASDQFSFGVTMYEALYRRRPYELDDTATSADTVPADAYVRAREEMIADLERAARTAEHAVRPPGAQTPAWLHAIVTRAMAADPSARLPSMTALAEALGRDRRRRTRLVAIAVAGLLAGTVATALVMRDSGDRCAGAPARLESIWSEPLRLRVRAALGDAPWTSHTLALLEQSAGSWQASYRRVCEATRVRGEQSDSLLDLRMRCLDQRLQRFAALTSVLGGSTLDDRARIAAPGAVAELPDPRSCETLAHAGELALPAARADRSTAMRVQGELADAWVQYSLGHYDEARRIAQAAELALGTIPVPGLRSAVLALLGSTEARIGTAPRARHYLEQALIAAAEAGAHEIEHDVWARLLRVELFGGDARRVHEWSAFARAAARRAGLQGAEIEALAGEALRAEGKLAAAHEHLARALASTDPLRADQRALLEMNLGSIELATGDAAAAIASFSRARDRILALYGDHHPDLALYTDKLAAAKRALGQLRDARKLHDRSLALRTAAFGEHDRAVATALHYRAQTLLEAGEVTGARTDITRARELRERVYGASSARVGEILAVLADVVAAGGGAGARDEALAHYDRATALDDRLELSARRFAAGATIAIDDIPPLDDDELASIDRLNALAVRAELLARAGRGDEAAAIASRLYTRSDASRAPAYGLAIGAALLATGDRARATDVLRELVPRLGNEPTRTALRIFVLLARAADADAPAAARAAISLYQAMPALDRTDMDEMWAISRR